MTEDKKEKKDKTNEQSSGKVKQDRQETDQIKKENQQERPAKKAEKKSEAKSFAKEDRGKKRERGRRKGKRKGRDRRERKEKEFEQALIDLARVTRVMRGGKRLSFRACMVIGDKKGRVGMGVAKGKDVSQAIQKAVRLAQKKLIIVPIVNKTIPHPIRSKFGASKVLLRPAPEGRGVVAGGVVRIVLSLAGVENVTAKMLGSKNKINNTKATFKAIQGLKTKKLI